jgi:glycosyltransferase involved in cell wall biosynthesis
MPHPLIAEPTVRGRLKVIFCVPSRIKAHPAFFEALEASIPHVIAAGFDEGMTFETGNPYISGARASMLKKALNANADIIVFLDDDLSWDPEDLVTLIKTPGDVVGGTYRCKEDELNYMGRILQDAEGHPTSIRADGCFECACLPAGFLKVTKEAVFKFMFDYPELCYGPPWSYAVDLFNHGAHKGLWWGEDYAFCRRWREKGGQVWLVPDLNINHHSWLDDKVYRGNFDQYMMQQPGGCNDPAKQK